MMFLQLLELWTVSAGIFLAVWYVLLSNTSGGVFLSSFTFVHLLLSWYIELGSSKKSLDRHERGIGLWCSLLLPLISMLSYRDEDHFLPLTVSAVFAHYTWTKSVTPLFLKGMAISFLLVLAGASLVFGSAILLVLFTPIFCLLYGAIRRSLSQSFTVGEAAIVSQLITFFAFKIVESSSQHLLGEPSETMDKTVAVIFISVSIATVLFVHLQFSTRTSVAFYIIFGLIFVVIVLPSIVFIIRLDGIKVLFSIMFKNKKSLFLFLWWVLCTVISIYIVSIYGGPSSSSPSLASSRNSVKELKDPSTCTNNADNAKSLVNAPSQSYSMAVSDNSSDIHSCRARTSDKNFCKEFLEIQPVDYSSNQLKTSLKAENERISDSKSDLRTFQQLSCTTTHVRKLFHLVMLAVYVPGLMCNTSALYLASVVALAVLFILELIRIYQVPPFGAILDQYFTVFLDKQDSGDLILTPIYLLIGCSLPLWFTHSHNGQADLKMYAGIISIGVGDAAASLVGRQLGKHRWPGSNKTVEGTLGAITFQLLAILILQMLYVPGSSLSVVTVVIVILVSCLEAFSGHIDNLVVSVYAFMLFSTTGTFI